MTRSGPLRIVISIVALAAIGGALATVFPRRSASPSAAPDSTSVAIGPKREVVRDTLSRGMALYDVMASKGLDPAQIHEISQLLRDYKSPRSLRPGVALRFSSRPGKPPDHIRLELNPDSVLQFTRTDSVWSASLELVPFVVDTVRLSGVIESSLWNARLGGDIDRLDRGGFEDLVYSLADVFAWKVDFTRDIRKGDAFRVALERQVRPDGSIRSRRFLAIELRNQDRLLRAIPFYRPGGPIAYYDEEGRSLRGAFLRYPVPYRITSRFTNRRYHPILKRYRPHQGIDYGAPPGTHVEATASGTVTREGWWGGYGRIVEIRHANGIRTRYAHLSGFARGVHVGSRVEQGQYIGRVGSSGLATGPHLHYEFLQNGKHRNPLSIEIPSHPALEASRMPAFREARDQALALLDGLPIPYDTRIAAGDVGPAASSPR
ncbi:MAG: M23 family metallopeptidase [Hyphomicrobiales bacterium]